MNKDPRLFIIHIIERLERIEQFTQEGQECFLTDFMVQDAVYRNFEVIGEAAKKIPEWVRIRFPDIPWKRMAGFRDVLIHQYEGIDPQEVWAALVNNRLLELQVLLKQVLGTMSHEMGETREI